MQCLAYHYRLKRALVVTLAASVSLFGSFANVLAGSSVYSHRAANGAVVFSDAPLINGQMTRTTYQTQFGRPVARSSCRGLSSADMASRAALLREPIESAAKAHKIDAELIKAVAQTESCFDPKAVSKVGARGIMQLMPPTAQELGVTDSFNVNQNIHGGARYLAQMLNRFNNNHRLALAAYNAGPSAVEKYKGIPPYPETQQYVKKVLGLYGKSRD